MIMNGRCERTASVSFTIFPVPGYSPICTTRQGQYSIQGFLHASSYEQGVEDYAVGPDRAGAYETSSDRGHQMRAGCARRQLMRGVFGMNS
jgi:hypothetical protein